MCGICGFVGLRQNEDLLQEMMDSLAHRGPDGSGHFCSDGVGLGHRRLSIIDVDGGRQPIANESGTIHLVCNGEIYNFRELRDLLLARGHRFRTRSDSEVILHLYEDEGADCVNRLVGMFAFAIYDEDCRRLFVARDRLGIKPLYYLELPGRFIFASEMKAILRYREFDPTIDDRSVLDYLVLRYVPGPGSMFKQIRKLPSGHSMTVHKGRVTLLNYWRPSISGIGEDDASEEEYLEEFAERFETSVARRLMSDVPLGAYLSAGVDSSVVVAAMAKAGANPVKTFTVGFDFEHNEQIAARETAHILECHHTEIACNVADMDLLPRLVYHLDEPLGDPIIVPMYLLAREASREVRVVLSGEGGDEILGGYLFHKALLAGHYFDQMVPNGLKRSFFAPLLRATPPSLLNLAFSYPAHLGTRGKKRVVDLLDLVEPERLPEAYRHLISLFDSEEIERYLSAEFLSNVEARSLYREEEEAVRSDAPFLNRILHLQFAHWLPDDILTKQDKMAMANGIEVRVPFLDHELVEFALSLPPRLKIRRWSSKLILRKYANTLLPSEVTRRRKMPFYFPLEKSVGEVGFRDLVEDTLSERSVRERGVLRPEAVKRLRESVTDGGFLATKQLFSLVMLELWMRMAVDRRAAY